MFSLPEARVIYSGFMLNSGTGDRGGAHPPSGRSVQCVNHCGSLNHCVLFCMRFV